ncbi:hypothetical protein D3C75_903190 [compost metagenome]
MAVHFHLNQPFAAAEMQMLYDALFRSRSHFEFMQVAYFDIFRTNQRLDLVAAACVFEALQLGGTFDQCRFPDEGRNKRCLRLFVNIPRRALLLQPALINNHDLIRNFNRFILVMGHENGGDADTLNQLTQP